MTFTRLGDEFPAITRDLSDAAFRTHVEALIWSNSRDLDLIVPRSDVPRFAETRCNLDQIIAELIECEFWIERDGMLDIGAAQQGRTRSWQYTAEQRSQQRVKSRDRQARLRERRESQLETTPSLTASLPNPTQPEPRAVTHGVSHGVTHR